MRVALTAVLFWTGCGTIQNAVCEPPTAYVAYHNRRVHCYGSARLPTENVLVRCNDGYEGLVIWEQEIVDR